MKKNPLVQTTVANDGQKEFPFYANFMRAVIEDLLEEFLPVTKYDLDSIKFGEDYRIFMWFTIKENEKLSFDSIEKLSNQFKNVIHDYIYNNKDKYMTYEIFGINIRAVSHSINSTQYLLKLTPTSESSFLEALKYRFEYQPKETTIEDILNNFNTSLLED